MSLPYRYSDLPQGSVRLLRLQPYDPSTGQDPRLECRFAVYPLLDSDTAHPFEALSYAWGPEENPGAILVDGGEVPIRANLHSALSHLRDRFLERILWVDAICINQQNADEKGHQVQSMAQIYAKASRVIVWLGEGTADGGGRALEYIRAVADERPLAISDHMNDAVLDLLERPWFERIWVSRYRHLRCSAANY